VRAKEEKIRAKRIRDNQSRQEILHGSNTQGSSRRENSEQGPHLLIRRIDLCPEFLYLRLVKLLVGAALSDLLQRLPQTRFAPRENVPATNSNGMDRKQFENIMQAFQLMAPPPLPSFSKCRQVPLHTLLGAWEESTQTGPLQDADLEGRQPTKGNLWLLQSLTRFSDPFL
jgi:hypothetical protein